eukprot:PITA_09882
MESEFEPVVRMEETPEARIVIFELPGFRTEDLRVQVNNRGNLIVSGERRVKEPEEKPKAGVRFEKAQSGGEKFRKVINIPQTVDIDDVTAKLKDQVLRVTLPKTNQKSPTQDVKGGKKPHAADLSEQSKPDQRSSPVKAQGLVQERLAAAQNDQSARLPEVKRPDDSEAKARAAAEKSKAEAQSPTQDVKGVEKPHSADLSEQSKPDQRSSPVKAQGWVQGRPEAAQNDQSARLPEVKRPDDSEEKARAAAEKSKAEAAKHAQELVHGEPPTATQTQAVSAQTGSKRDRSEVTQGKSEEPKKEDESCLPWPNVQMPEKRIKFPSSLRCSMPSNRRILIASAVLVLSAGMYLSYTLRSRKED